MSPMQPSPLFLLTVVLLGAVEYLWRRSDGKPWDRAGVLSTLVIMAGQVLSKAMTAALIGVVLFAAYDVAPVHWELNHWTTWAAGFVAIEFAYYWMHRASHRVRWFWATHNVHHSPTVFILPVALRLGWTGGVTGSWIFYVPLALLGFHPVLIGTLLLINLRYQFFLHTEQVRSLGPLEWFMNTPSHHRVHHASNNRYLDKNFGGVLIVFDRLFGTFAAETADESIRYGLTEPAPNDRPLRVVFHEWTRIYHDLGHCKTASDVVAVLFGPPRSDANPPSFELKMPRRALTSVILVLILGGGVGVAWSSAKAQSNPWVGKWQRTNTGADDRERSAAIDRALSDVSRLFRGRAKSALEEDLTPSGTMKLSLENGALLLAGKKQLKLPLDGTPVRIDGERGPSTVTVSQRSDALVVQAKGSKGDRTQTFRVIDNVLVVHTKLSPKKLSTSVEFSTRYKRR